MERISSDTLRARLATRLASHPLGTTPGGARIGAAFHSETLQMLDLIAPSSSTPWQARVATDHDEQAVVCSHDTLAIWRPQRFARTSRLSLQAALTMETLPGYPLVHRNGTSYTGVALAYLEAEAFAIYRSQDGVWWARPWAMFADGRFQARAPRCVDWRNPLETDDA